jgi:hypothetical protein
MGGVGAIDGGRLEGMSRQAHAVGTTGPQAALPSRSPTAPWSTPHLDRWGSTHRESQPRGSADRLAEGRGRPPLGRPQGRSDGVRTTPWARRLPRSVRCAQHEHTEIPYVAVYLSKVRVGGGSRRSPRRHRGTEQRKREKVGGWPGRITERANAVRANTAPSQQQTLSSGSVSPCLRGALLRLDERRAWRMKREAGSLRTNPFCAFCVLCGFSPAGLTPRSRTQPPHAGAVPPQP